MVCDENNMELHIEVSVLKINVIPDPRPERRKENVMNEKITEILKQHWEKNNWEFDPENSNDLLEVLGSERVIYSKVVEEHRWWDDVFTVVKIGEQFIGFDDAHTTGDTSPTDTGWEFDPNSICEVESETKTTVIYKPVT